MAEAGNRLLYIEPRMAESAQKVLHELTAAGLLSSDQVTTYAAEIETGAEALLARLLKDGHITQYQCDKFNAGEASEIHFGDYVVIDKLGKGGMGTVLLAKHRRMERQVAIKVLPVTVLESKEAVARFYQEVKVAGQLTHPNIVHAYDAGEHKGFHYLVMEYVQGHDLAQVLSHMGPVPTSLALDYISQAASGLEYAHGMQIVHRDIKPSNLLLDDEGKIKILDMGLARITAGGGIGGGGILDSEASVHLTTTGQVMGTVEYMSPEQAEDTRQADARSDIYSLGCTLYRLVTGRGPYSRETVVKTILAHRDAPIPIIDTGSPDDAAINHLFRKMVAKDPADRFGSATLLLEAIREIEEGTGPEFVDEPEPPIEHIEPGGDTAVAVRIQPGADGLTPEEMSLPEAIIPIGYDEDDSIDEFIEVPPGYSESAITNSNSLGSKASEVVYIPDTAVSGGSVGGSVKQTIKRVIKPVINWLNSNRSHRILIWSLVALALAWMPVVGVAIGVFNWRGANQDLRDIGSGKRPPQGSALTHAGKILSIIATVVSGLSTLGVVGSLLF